MRIEILLSLNTNKLGGTGTLLTRNSYNCDNISEYQDCILKFLQDNIDILYSKILDQSIIDNIKVLNRIENNTLASIRNSFNTAGLDIITYWIEEQQSSTSISELCSEFLVLNTNYTLFGNCAQGTKYIVDTETYSISDILSSISKDFNLFSNSEKGLYKESEDILLSKINEISSTSDKLGLFNPTLLYDIERILISLNKIIYLLN